MTRARRDARLGLRMGWAVDDDDIVLARLALDLAGDAPTADRGNSERSAVPLCLAKLEPGRQDGLGVDIDDRDTVTGRRPSQGKMDGKRRLAGTALLLRDGDDGRRDVCLRLLGKTISRTAT